MLQNPPTLLGDEVEGNERMNFHDNYKKSLSLVVCESGCSKNLGSCHSRSKMTGSKFDIKKSDFRQNRDSTSCR